MVKMKLIDIGCFNYHSLDGHINKILEDKFSDKKVINAQLDIVRHSDSGGSYIGHINLIVFYED